MKSSLYSNRHSSKAQIPPISMSVVVSSRIAAENINKCDKGLALSAHFRSEKRIHFKIAKKRFADNFDV